MRRAATLTVIAALTLVSFAGGGTAPRFGIVRAQPLTVIGSGFPPGVTLSVAVSGTAHGTKKATVGRAGSFRAVFSLIRLNRCTASILVTVSYGGQQVAKRLPARDCPPL